MGVREPQHQPSSGATPGEVQLVERAQQGDAAAWASLCHEHFVALHRHVGFLVHDPDVADDLTQEVFAHALAGLHRFDRNAALRPWLRGIALNLVRKHWRSNERRARAMAKAAAAPADTAEEPDDTVLRRQRAEALLAAVEDLPGHLREAFVLCDLQGMAPGDAAAELGLSPGNLRVRATRARARLRRTLEGAGWM